MFCVECGREEELYGGLCSQCYIEKNVFITIPERIDIEVCAYCGVRRKGRIWVRNEPGTLFEESIIESARIHKDVTHFDVHIEPVSETEMDVSLKLKWMLA
jgi:NMD protein affecting ribosome stability and mRNA decay